MAEIIDVQGIQQEEQTLREAAGSVGLPEAFSCLLGALEIFHRAAKGQEPQSCHDEIRRVSSALCGFLGTLVPAAPSGVVDDIAYVVVLYLLKGSMKCESQGEHDDNEETRV